MDRRLISDWIVTFVVTIYFIACFFNWAIYRTECWKLNIFQLLDVSASEEMADYEQIKGESNVELKAKFDYTEEDLIMLAQIIQAEAGGDYLSDELREYVGSVVLNRVEDSRFPNSIREVILQPGQYYPVMSGTYRKEPDERCLQIATELLEMGQTLPPEVVWQANFTQGRGTYLKIEGMYFCY